MEAQLPGILEAGVVSPLAPGTEPAGDDGQAHPLAVDIDGDLGAVSFAIFDPYPHIAGGWWCVAACVQREADGSWPAFVACEHDNTTSPTPFTRPLIATNGNGWIDWHSNGPHFGFGVGDDGAEEWRHSFFGIAPAGTARLVLADEHGRERDLRITPFNGAYVAYLRGTRSTLTGYDAGGAVLGSIEPVSGLNEDW